MIDFLHVNDFGDFKRFELWGWFGVLQLYILKKRVTCYVIVLSSDISSMSLFQTVYYYLNINHPLIDFLISLIHLGVLGFWGNQSNRECEK